MHGRRRAACDRDPARRRPAYLLRSNRTLGEAEDGNHRHAVPRHVPGDGDTPSLWSFWLGFNISHGLGVFTFGLLCLLIATHDFEMVERIDAIRPLTIAFSATYLALSLRFWFYGPAIVTGIATACFTVATLLSA